MWPAWNSQTLFTWLLTVWTANFLKSLRVYWKWESANTPKLTDMKFYFLGRNPICMINSNTINWFSTLCRGLYVEPKCCICWLMQINKLLISMLAHKTKFDWLKLPKINTTISSNHHALVTTCNYSVTILCSWFFSQFLALRNILVTMLCLASVSFPAAQTGNVTQASISISSS